ncbi:MAG: Gfo/Idh/MocA family oxidoreductase [Acidobacteria bacterium]|nr:Gfo/Idh/MocA family oxidoreductase [Acidobacteriota bacterium]
MTGGARQLGVGVVGAGFLAETRARCWKQVVSASVAGVVSRRREHAENYARRFDVPAVFADLDAMLADPLIDVVDLCVPNRLHREMAEAAAAAGKHVICTKPLTAYTGQDLQGDASDADVAGRDRREMMRVAEADARAMVEAAKRAGVQLLYGENWIYAPAFRRALGLLAKADSVLLEMRGGECHSGSHSPYSRVWRHTGGGAVIRLAAHPVGAMLHLKRTEGLRRSGKPVRPAWVSAETADLSAVAGVSAEELRIAGGWGEVENWGCAVIGFDDGSRAVAWGGDHVLGGMESGLDLFASNCRLRLNLSPNDMLRAYASDGKVFDDVYIMEKIDSGAGWTTPMPDEDWTSGQLGMCQAFAANLLDGVAAESDGELGLEVVRVLYSAYVSAVEGRRVDLSAGRTIWRE